MHGFPTAKLDAEFQDTQSTATRLADLLTSGLTGTRLLAELNRVFSRAVRFDVFCGVVIATSLFEADRVALLHELLVAESRPLAPADQR